MKKLFSYFIGGFLSIFAAQLAFAAECASANYDLNSQAEVDALGETECDVVVGDLTIQGSTVESLLPLSNLELVNGKLRILNNPKLSSLDGLEKLRAIGERIFLNGRNLEDISALSGVQSIGGVLQLRNTGVQDVDAFFNLTSIQAISLEDNYALKNINGFINITEMEFGFNLFGVPALENLDGFSNLPSVVGGSSRIFYAPALENIDGLSGLRRIDGFLDIESTGIEDIDGLSNLERVEGTLRIWDNENLKDIDGLSNLDQVESIYIIYAHQLRNLNGLSNLRSISGDLRILSKSLENVNGLRNLASVGGYFEITSGLGGMIDPAEFPLQEIDGLASLSYVGGDFRLDGFPNLSDCRRLGTLLGWPNGPPRDQIGGEILISSNGSGCNSVDEVLDSISTFENLLFSVQRARGG